MWRIYIADVENNDGGISGSAPRNNSFSVGKAVVARSAATNNARRRNSVPLTLYNILGPPYQHL